MNAMTAGVVLHVLVSSADTFVKHTSSHLMKMRTDQLTTAASVHDK